MACDRFVVCRYRVNTSPHVRCNFEHLLEYQKNGYVVDDCGFHDFHCVPYSFDNMYQVKQFKSEDIVQA